MALEIVLDRYRHTHGSSPYWPLSKRPFPENRDEAALSPIAGVMGHGHRGEWGMSIEVRYRPGPGVAKGNGAILPAQTHCG
jgi:hypothetical protein